MAELSRFANVPVYTRAGTFVGNVKNLLLDLDGNRIDSVVVGRTNPKLVPTGQDVAVPYRWVASFDDILILRHFPDLSALAPEQDEVPEGDEQFDAVPEIPAPVAPRAALPARPPTRR
ncbi:MAG TPA: PRC-barrel domain-containing protein [Candidatus Thermoplasmatota archaeon]|nr:PRC-barrel domain-containing protein [Candidatus Thermoplasmatota archaeon]